MAIDWKIRDVACGGELYKGLYNEDHRALMMKPKEMLALRDLLTKTLEPLPVSNAPVNQVMLEALGIGESWLDRWAQHVGSCKGGDICTCGLTRVKYDLRAAIAAAEQSSPASKEQIQGEVGKEQTTP